jgi:RNA polymerase sigma-70 factor (ECF subfamily)
MGVAPRELPRSAEAVCPGNGAYPALLPAAPLSIIATVPTPVDPHRSVIRQLMEGREVEENFRQLFQTYYPAVSGFFARKGFTRDESRDLTQEVFVAVYVGMENLRSEAAFVSWLFSTARHIGFRHLDRRRKSFGAAPVATGGVDEGDRENPVELAATPDPDPLRRVLDQEKVTVLKEAIEALPDRVQDCLRARLVEDLSYREIGERLGISENTVAVHVHRGVKTIRARLKLFFGEAPSGGG